MMTQNSKLEKNLELNPESNVNVVVEQNPSVKKTKLTVLLFGIFLLCVSSGTNKINSTEALMKEITSRYNGKWFTQIKFSQYAYMYKNDSLVETEICDEEYSFPSTLIIYKRPETANKSIYQKDTANRNIYRNDTAFTYENNELVRVEKITHDAVILSMDIYNMTLSDIMNRWKDLTIKYEINKFHEAFYNGRKVYVIGADKGDTLSNQIWYDAEHLYFIKQIKTTEKGLRETNFLDYVQLEDKGWIEREVEFKLNGKVFMREKYFDIQVVK